MAINLVQDLNVEVDSMGLLKQYLELALPTVLDSIEEIAVKVIDHNDKHKSLYYPSVIYGEKHILPVLLIGGWYKQESDKDRSFFNGYKPWELFNGKDAQKNSIEYILDILNPNKSDLTDRFFNDCGNGYNGGFNHFDGDINVGYKLISNRTFPNSLSLSLVHIYYGK